MKLDGRNAEYGGRAAADEASAEIHVAWHGDAVACWWRRCWWHSDCARCTARSRRTSRRSTTGSPRSNSSNLNSLKAREDLLPALSSIADEHAREEAARQIYYVSGSLGNVGALARIHGLFTGEQFRQLKPLFVVRRPAQFTSAFYRWSALFIGGFPAGARLLERARIPRRSIPAPDHDGAERRRA